MVHWAAEYDLQTPAHILYLNEVNTVFLTIYLKVIRKHRASATFINFNPE